MATTMKWLKEDVPRWDDDKQRLFDDTALLSVGMDRPHAGAALADEWWHVLDDGGAVVGYGWLDSEWGDAQITFFVDPSRRGQGIGSFVLGHLEDESRKRGLNYIYNVVPDSHPDRAWMTAWLQRHGLRESTHGDLRRRVDTLPS
jgi:GNAT superfamily N-acetyltransferase